MLSDRVEALLVLIISIVVWTAAISSSEAHPPAYPEGVEVVDTIHEPWNAWYMTHFKTGELVRWQSKGYGAAPQLTKTHGCTHLETYKFAIDNYITYWRCP